jgi:hypothetical protein
MSVIAAIPLCTVPHRASMMSDRDIRRCAQDMLDRYESSAPTRAAQCTAELAAQQDREGVEAWRRIEAEILRLRLRTIPFAIC